MKTITPLGESPFNYHDYTIWRFIHYWQQITEIMRLRPKSVLEIGPGDHTVSDFLIRKGLDVVTADNDPAVKPDNVIDLLDMNFVDKFDRSFDLCLASEVLEHLSFKHFLRVLVQLGNLARFILISVPYTTIRLFPERSDYGKVISCEGRLMTRIPYYCLNIPLDISRFFKTLLFSGSVSDARSQLRFGLTDYPDSFQGHHWDCGFWRFRPAVIRRLLADDFIVHREKVYVNTNCIFWVLSLRQGNKCTASGSC
ncbi:MAG: hypothetical protein D4R73_07320 [Deltaproteobacteria bacterium]|nr:MAG: hypothetical protein D4R73_07320 [Deltaproteobacteria bacterium]